MSDKSNTGVPEDEKKTNDLLALLYPEDDASIGGSEVLSEESLGDEIGGMQSLRSLFRDLPDEEPSDAVTNKLMALAAQHAPKPASESQGVFAWFYDLFQPVLGHPGFAAAATLVLVVGVAGTLYVKGEVKMAEPQVSSQADSPADRQAAPSSASGRFNDTKSGAFEVAPSSREEQGATLADEGEQDPAFAAPIETRSNKGPASKNDGALKDQRSNEFKKRKRSTSKTGRGDAYGGKLGLGSGKDRDRIVAGLVDVLDDEAAPEPSTDEQDVEREAPARRAPVKKTANRPRPKPAKSTKSASDDSSPPPPPAAPSTGSAGLSGQQAIGETATVEKKEEGNRSEGLHAKAVAAAGRGDCPRVLALGRQIRKLDSSYYDRTFLSDKRLTACRNKSQSK